MFNPMPMEISLRFKTTTTTTRKPAWDVCSIQVWTTDTEMPNINITFLKSNLSCLDLAVRN